MPLRYKFFNNAVSDWEGTLNVGNLGIQVSVSVLLIMTSIDIMTLIVLTIVGWSFGGMVKVSTVVVLNGSSNYGETSVTYSVSMRQTWEVTV